MTARRPEDFCESCGGYIGPYKHGLSKVLVSALRKLYSAYGQEFASRAQIEQIMTRNEDTNLQKLQHWSLVEKRWDPVEKKVVRGWWRVTEDGAKFIVGAKQAREFVWSLDNEFDHYEGELIYAHEVDITCWDHDDYVQTRGTS